MDLPGAMENGIFSYSKNFLIQYEMILGYNVNFDVIIAYLFDFKMVL